VVQNHPQPTEFATFSIFELLEAGGGKFAVHPTPTFVYFGLNVCLPQHHHPASLSPLQTKCGWSEATFERPTDFSHLLFQEEVERKKRVSARG
jgi:hypothetical protein